MLVYNIPEITLYVCATMPPQSGWRFHAPVLLSRAYTISDYIFVNEE